MIQSLYFNTVDLCGREFVDDQNIFVKSENGKTLCWGIVKGVAWLSKMTWHALQFEGDKEKMEFKNATNLP